MITLATSLLALLLSWPALAGVNINTADAAELDALPGIGASKAADIVAFRDEHGAFSTAQDLGKVPGIGPATLTSLADLIHAGDGTTVAPPLIDPSGPPADAVDINQASASELSSLPGIGPAKAQDIVDYRQDNGEFLDCDDLVKVRGIGPATVRSIGTRCLTQEPSAAEEPKAPREAENAVPDEES